MENETTYMGYMRNQFNNFYYSGEFVDTRLIKNQYNLIQEEQQDLVKEFINLPKMKGATKPALLHLHKLIFDLDFELRMTKQFSLNWQMMIMHVACIKLDKATRDAWHSHSGVTIDIHDLLQFIRGRASSPDLVNDGI
ncbi:PREDICTED: uncharacterized protein LOC108557793 [Nicrophorus vespilloides]|uniref:Uncharacterized protein LOC108557793 n=1 Tax=Nicrophorus vespilloides TaxID=110193 RepID=A0ABM1M5U2_NICVS|nr:PREDICTED: uncharacterized protein LOC108557793 [Nicrophorus vespilloides]